MFDNLPGCPGPAEREGFEPSDPVSQVNSLAVSPIRPLSHLSRYAYQGFCPWHSIERNLEVSETPSKVPTGPTFAGLLDEWLSYGRSVHGRPWAPKTAFDNHRQVEARILPALGKVRLSDLSARHLENAYTSWTAEGLADSSVHRLSALISSALSFAVRRDYLDSSPAMKAVALAQGGSNRKVPTAEEARQLVRAAVTFGKDMAPAIALAALTGARVGEVAALRWGDIDLHRGLVRIDKSVTEVQGVVTIKSTKTGDEHMARVEGGNLIVLQEVLNPGDDDQYVIDGETDPINPGVISDRFTCVPGLAHIRGVTFHSLRKYYATSLLSAGVLFMLWPLRAAGSQPGWSWTSTAERPPPERVRQQLSSCSDRPGTQRNRRSFGRCRFFYVRNGT